MSNSIELDIITSVYHILSQARTIYTCLLLHFFKELGILVTQLFLTFLSFCILHTLFWYSSNYQLIEGTNEKWALFVCIGLSIPTALGVFYSTKYGYETLGSAWSVRLFGFGVGYFIFPILTWFHLNESPFNLKTLLSIGLAVLILFIQLIIPNN